jgi:hypothetical protein
VKEHARKMLAKLRAKLSGTHALSVNHPSPGHSGRLWASLLASRLPQLAPRVATASGS